MFEWDIDRGNLAASFQRDWIFLKIDDRCTKFLTLSTCDFFAADKKPNDPLTAWLANQNTKTLIETSMNRNQPSLVFEKSWIEFHKKISGGISRNFWSIHEKIGSQEFPKTASIEKDEPFLNLMTKVQLDLLEKMSTNTKRLILIWNFSHFGPNGVLHRGMQPWHTRYLQFNLVHFDTLI